MIMLLIFILMLSVIISPSGPMEGAKGAVNLCMSAVIPSLFPFFVLNHMLLASGAIVRFCNRFGKSFARLFNLPAGAAGAVILGFMSGYPAGAKAAGDLLDNGVINPAEYKRLVAFCNNAGPVFITGTVGIGMFGSKKCGLILFSAHFLSSILVGLIFRFYKNDEISHIRSVCRFEKKSFTELFTEAVSSSVSSIAQICGYIIFFGMLTSRLSAPLSGLSDLSRGIFTGIFEMTNGSKLIAASSAAVAIKMAAVSGIIGFGGLCVHAQSAAILRHKKTYLAGKTIQGMLSVFITYFMCRNMSLESSSYSIRPTVFMIVLLSVTTVLYIISAKALRQFRHS